MKNSFLFWTTGSRLALKAGKTLGIATLGAYAVLLICSIGQDMTKKTKK